MAREKIILLQYWKNIVYTAWKTMCKDIGLLGIAIDLVISVSVSWLVDKTFDYGWILMFAKVFIFLLILAWLYYILKVSAIQDKEKTAIITLKEYEDIQLVYYPYPIAADYKKISIWDATIFDILAFKIKNRGGVSLVECRIKFLNAKYRNNVKNSKTWITMPNIEQKLLKWDDELRGKDGLIDISADDSEIIKLAELLSDKSGITNSFYFVFSDKNSDMPRNSGEYNITLSLNAKVERNGLLIDIMPLLFNINFDYTKTGQIFNFGKVERHER